MKKYFFFILFLLISCYSSFSQTAKDTTWGIKFTGFVSNDFTYDSRQNVNLREGMFLLYPSPVQHPSIVDTTGDINAKPNFNFFAIKTRIAGKIKMPDALGAKTSGLIEAEFFGSTDATINTFRLRHAFVQLDWDNTSLLAGQFWHPFFVTDCYPGTLSFNTGSPFQPFIRSPQIRVTQKLGDHLKVLAAAASQRDFSSPGPNGASYSYLSKALIPDLNVQAQLKFGDHLFGVAGNYKKLMPRDTTKKGQKAEETIDGISGLAYLKLSFQPVTFKMEAIYGSNLADMLMLGGYAVKTLDTVTGKESYTPINCYSAWGDLSFNSNDFEIAVFAGYTKNLGSQDNITLVSSTYIPAIYTFKPEAATIDYIYRISPRIGYLAGSVKLAAELEVTTAAYGTKDFTDKYKVINSKPVTNIRGLVTLFYYF